jgi:hypothetical protein
LARLHRLSLHVEAVDEDRARSRRQKAGQQTDERGLARAVGPEQAEDLAAADFQIEAIERRYRAVALAQGVGLHRDRGAGWDDFAHDNNDDNKKPAAASAGRGPVVRLG